MSHQQNWERRRGLTTSCSRKWTNFSAVKEPSMTLEAAMPLSRPWHPINPVPLCPIVSTRLLPVPLYVPMVPDYLYSLCITTDQWALCPVRLSIWLLNVFPFTIPVTNCSCPIIFTNMIHLGESAMNITKLTHSAAWTALVDGLPDSSSIAPYILQ